MVGRTRTATGRREPPVSRPAFIEIEHKGLVHRVALKRVASARRFTLRVRTARRDVVLTLPPHGSPAAARAFALRYAGWIAEKLDALAPAIACEPGTQLPFRGRIRRLAHRPSLLCRIWTEEDQEEPLLCVGGPFGRFADTLQRGLRRQARADLTEATQRYASEVGKTVRGLTLRDTRSRWGSCTARGTLNFSWRLVLAPPFVLDYLAAHEVAHLVEMNHSAAFWAVLDGLSPRIDEAEAWLKQHGPSLHRYTT